jgi:predicted TIM-barrel fold metal-dependent hydrolase
MAETAGRPHLIPAWFVTPDGREPRWNPQVLVAEMLVAGVRLAWLDPEAEMLSLQPWCAGPLYAALQDHRIPLLLPYPKVKADDLHLILAAYPQLPVVLINVLRLGRNRLLEPLLALHPQLYLCFGPSFSVHGYFRDLCNRYGPYRWVWGAGYPEFEGGAGVAGLTYAGLNAEELSRVAHGNMERLLAEVTV